MSLLKLLGNSAKCRTVDVCDIFGDSSGKALYRLDGNANDESGNYHGTETGVSVYGGGMYERGFVSSNTNTNFISTTAIPSGEHRAISLWINPTALPVDATYHTVYSAYNAGFNQGLLIKFISAGLYSIDAYINISGSRYRISTPPQTALTLGTWTNIVCVLESNNTLSIYKNGLSLVSGATATIDAVAYYGVLKFGQYVTDGTYNAYTFKGSIDQVRIFNRAVTVAEVATLYAECAPTSTVDNINPFEDGSLKALYQFNGDATDKTGVYNGTATNVTYGTGKFGQCAVFNGASSISAVGLAGTYSRFSVSALFKYGATTNTREYMFTSAGTTINFGYSANKCFLIVLNGVTVYSQLGTSIVPQDNLFHHVVVTWDMALNSGIPKAYVDGVLQTLTGATGCTTTTPVVSPKIFDNTDNTGCMLDQFSIFNKALTPMEVAALYTETTPLEEPMHSLVDPFKDGSGKALYRLDGNSLDESGNYNGTATNVTYGAGRFSRAAIIATGKVDTGSKLLMPSTSNYSVSLWIKRTAAERNVMVGRMNTATVFGDDFYWESDNTIKFRIADTATTLRSWITSPINKVGDGLWHHIVLTVNRSNTISLYLDNILQTWATSNTAVNSYDNSLNTLIGAYHNTNYNGNYDQVRFFNKALTAAEVQTLYTEI